jgi:hypothetical protein
LYFEVEIEFWEDLKQGRAVGPQRKAVSIRGIAGGPRGLDCCPETVACR